MFPYFKLFWQTIYFQWIWIILATAMFIYWVYRYSKKFNLKTSTFISFLPFFIIVPYFLWRYVYDLLTYHFIFPTSFTSLISPYHYNFSFIGVSFGIFFMIFFYILSLKYRQEKLKTIDVFFYSICLSLVVLWPFLLLWDNFYWIWTNSVFGISPLTVNTQIPMLELKRWPVWIFLSLLWLWLYLLTKIIYLIVKKPGISLFVSPLLFLWLAYIFHFQLYPKHFLFWIDVKLLYCYIMAILVPVILYLLTLNKQKW